MKTKLCEFLEIEKPIISAPMGGAVRPRLIAAVSEGGGFGVIPLWGGDAEQVRKGIADVRSLTRNNFAVNLNLSFPFEDHLQACIDEQVFAVSLFWGENPNAIEKAKDGGLLVFSTAGSAEEAKRAEAAGADIIVAQGWEAGGHVWGKVSTLALIPAVVDAVNVPVIAAGGIADGRGLAAALMLGASGAWIGTRFLAAEETEIHEIYRRHIFEASETQTEWVEELYNVWWPDAPHRALVNSTSADWHDAGCPDPGSRPNENEVIGTKASGDPVVRYQSHTPAPGTSGNIEAMSLWAGQGVSLVDKPMKAAEIIDEIFQNAKQTMRAACEYLD